MGQHFPLRYHCAVCFTLLFCGVCALSKANAADELSSLNRVAGSPAILLSGEPSVVVTSADNTGTRPAKLVGLNYNEVALRTAAGKVFRVNNSDIGEIRTADGRLSYRPSDEDLESFIARLQADFPNFAAAYAVQFNDGGLGAYFGSATISASSSRPPTVPLPGYSSEQPWVNVALLNPPRPKRKPAPVVVPPKPPPAVEPAPSGGIPTWGKFAIAACGVAALFLVVRR